MIPPICTEGLIATAAILFVFIFDYQPYLLLNQKEVEILKTFNKSKLQSVALRCAAHIAGLLTVGVLRLVVYILIKGVPHLSLICSA